jgi:hypothetical protein
MAARTITHNLKTEPHVAKTCCCCAATSGQEDGVVRGLAEGLGVTGRGERPDLHADPNRGGQLTLFHVDLYRIEDP